MVVEAEVFPSVWTMLNCDQIANTGTTVRGVYPGGWGYCQTAGYDVTMHFMDSSYWTATTGANAPNQKMAITMYKNAGHGGWSKAYRSQYMWNWLFAQSRSTIDSVVVSAGNDIVETLPKNQIVLNGSAYSLVGAAISTYLWTKESGPTVTMSGVSTSDLNITDLKAGNYRFKLIAVDVNGTTNFDEVNVEIQAMLVPPIAEAGSNQSLLLPQDTTLLNGNNSYDPDGSIVDYEWKMIGSNVLANDSDTIVTPGDTTAYKVLINFTPSWLQVAAPWNNMNGSINAGASLTNMSDDNGNATTMDIELLTNWGGSKTGGKTTGNNSGVYPDNIINGLYWFQNTNPRIRISGFEC